jgi:hypothetical protein
MSSLSSVSCLSLTIIGFILVCLGAGCQSLGFCSVYRVMRTYDVAFTTLHSVGAALSHSARLASLPFWLRWWFSMSHSSFDVCFIVPRQFVQIVPAHCFRLVRFPFRLRLWSSVLRSSGQTFSSLLPDCFAVPMPPFCPRCRLLIGRLL